MKKVVFSIFLIVLIGAGAFWLRVESNRSEVEKRLLLPTPPSSVLSNNSVDRREIVYGLPVTLVIPRIDVNATVEHVGLDNIGNMDVPKRTENVAWYQLGYKPGEVGNAVIAGHYDTKTGAPAVFWNISHLVEGDQLRVTDDSGHMLTFKVTHKATYPYNNFPIKEVFGSSTNQRLNLITCGGTWSPTKRIYSDRIVVFSELVKE